MNGIDCVDLWPKPACTVHFAEEPSVITVITEQDVKFTLR